MGAYTEKYVKIDSGYMGQLEEWSEVVTECRDLEECRAVLHDALNEMKLAYKQMGRAIPPGKGMLDGCSVEARHVGQEA